jgi:predicted nucleic acid-binding protein
VIYIDTSVVLSHVLAEDVRPSADFWDADERVASRLTEYEAWVRLHGYAKGPTHGRTLALTLATVHLLELDDGVCARCRAPFPVPIRTLDALHLATADFLRDQGFTVQVATYDARMRDAALAMGFALAPL